LESLALFKTFKERWFFFGIAFVIFLVNIYIHFVEYKKFIRNEVYFTHGTIVNIYNKKNFSTLKIKTDNFTFFTNSNENNLILFQKINLYVISNNISFISYLKGFYSKSFNITFQKNNATVKQKLYDNINNQHQSYDISSLYCALFIATPLTPMLREFTNNFGISHLIAISGFHLGIISIVLYFCVHLVYYRFHSIYFPYRNKRFDILLIVSVLLFCYLIFLDIPASLLRALVMFLFALFLVRNNIKILSFETLFIISILIISCYPKLLFSLSLWFSIAGVFYIFLFLKYFHSLHKYIKLLFFNFWIYLAINPITHYFFPTTSLEQLYSPILSILFTIFYPASVILHILQVGGIVDSFLISIANMDIYTIEVYTKDWIFISYIVISLLATVKKSFFLLLNFFMLVYNLWLFHFIF